MTPAAPRESGRRVGPTEQYARVPEQVITDSSLGHAAVRIWAYCWLVAGREGWILRKSDICARVGVGDDAWTRATQELTRAGLYELRRDRYPAGSVDADGKSCGGQARIEHVIYWPGYGPTGPSHPIPAAPPETGGRRTASRKKGGDTIDRGAISKIAVAALRGGDLATGAAATAHDDPAPARPMRLRRACGIVCWVNTARGLDDRPEAERVEANATPAEIEAAVAEVEATDKSPVPGTVWQSILRRRAALEIAARARAREAAAPLAEAKRRQAERERREADPAARQAGRAAREKAAKELGFGDLRLG